MGLMIYLFLRVTVKIKELINRIHRRQCLAHGTWLIKLAIVDIISSIIVIKFSTFIIAIYTPSK